MKLRGDTCKDRSCAIYCARDTSFLREQGAINCTTTVFTYKNDTCPVDISATNHFQRVRIVSRWKILTATHSVTIARTPKINATITVNTGPSTCTPAS